MENQRRQKREQLIFYLKVHEQGTENYLGRVIDMSDKGLMLITTRPIEKGVELKVSIKTPVDFEVDQISLTIENKWCNRDVNKDYFVAGFVIGNIDEDQSPVVRQLLRDYTFSMVRPEDPEEDPEDE